MLWVEVVLAPCWGPASLASQTAALCIEQKWYTWMAPLKGPEWIRLWSMDVYGLTCASDGSKCRPGRLTEHHQGITKRRAKAIHLRGQSWTSWNTWMPQHAATIQVLIFQSLLVFDRRSFEIAPRGGVSHCLWHHECFFWCALQWPTTTENPRLLANWLESACGPEHPVLLCHKLETEPRQWSEGRSMLQRLPSGFNLIQTHSPPSNLTPICGSQWMKPIETGLAIPASRKSTSFWARCRATFGYDLAKK